MIAEDIELGTCRSAVESFVNLMAVAIDVPEVQLHYWLDCYYQLRRSYEAEIAEEEPEAEAEEPKEDTTPPPKKKALEKKLEVEPPVFSGKKAGTKQEAYNKLLAARASGITFSELSQSTNYMLSEGDVMSMVNAAPMTDRKWEIMAGALESLEKRGKIGNHGGS